MTELTAADLVELADRLGLGPLDRWARIEAGTINSNYWIEAGGERYFVRVNEGKTADDLDYERALVATLRAAGVRTPAIVATATMRDRPIFLFEWIDGEHRRPGDISASDTASVAAALASLHRAGQGFDRRRAGIYRTADIAARAESFAGSTDPQLAGAIPAIAAELAFLEARAANRAGLARAVIHQDLFPDNVLFAPDQAPALIDFEQAADGAALYDLAVLINSWCFDGATLDQARVAGAVDGFGGSIDVEALWVELRAAAVRFAVTRITDVYLAGLSREGKDFREFLDRGERWRQIGSSGLAGMLGVE